jgi:hypothetical protein
MVAEGTYAGEWIVLYYEIPDYNPEWVSVDIWGTNIRIPQTLNEPPPPSPLDLYWGPGSPGGVIVHECLPKPNGNNSPWLEPVLFNTDAALPYCESFPGTWPSGWTQGFTPDVTANRWSIEASNEAGGAENEMMAIYDYENTIGESWLTSPVIVVPASLAILNFKHIYYDWDLGVTMKVRYSNDGGSSWTTGWSFASGSGGLGPETISVPITLSGDVIIQWYITGDHYQFIAWFIDDVCIVPTCDIANTWTGMIDNSWTKAGNWSCGVVPGPTTKVIIPPNPAGGHTPFIAAPLNEAVLSLDLMGESVVTVETGAKLTVLQP